MLLSSPKEGNLRDVRILIKGAGDLATGVAYRLYRRGARLLMTELPRPLAVRRTVSFSEAVFDGRQEVQGVRAVRAATLAEAEAAQDLGEIPVMVDPQASVRRSWQPQVVVDATIAKRNPGTSINDAPVVIALGPGFSAGVDCQAVVETNRGPNLGRPIYSGAAEPNTGEPGPVLGVTYERVVRSPATGVFRALTGIGAFARRAEVLGEVETAPGQTSPVVALIEGVVRGLIRDGSPVETGMKIGDIDPRGDESLCYAISDKALAIGDGVIVAIERLLPGGGEPGPTDETGPDLFARAREILENSGRAAMLVLVEGPAAGKRLLLTGVLDGAVGCEALWHPAAPDDGELRRMGEAAAAGLLEGRRAPGLAEIAPGSRAYLEALETPPTMLVLGGGHISVPLVQMARMLEYRVILIEDRPAFAGQSRFPGADQVICDDFAAGIDRVQIDRNTFAVIVTRGHRHDRVCLEKLLRAEAPYIGMIGSRRRVIALKKELLESDPSLGGLDRLYAPIGLDIGAEGPAEIALSILAEVTAVRRGASGGFLRREKP